MIGSKKSYIKLSSDQDSTLKMSTMRWMGQPAFYEQSSTAEGIESYMAYDAMQFENKLWMHYN